MDCRVHLLHVHTHCFYSAFGTVPRRGVEISPHFRKHFQGEGSNYNVCRTFGKPLFTYPADPDWFNTWRPPRSLRTRIALQNEVHRGMKIRLFLWLLNSYDTWHCNVTYVISCTLRRVVFKSSRSLPVVIRITLTWHSLVQTRCCLDHFFGFLLERRGWTDRSHVTAGSKSQLLYYLYWSIPLA